MKYYKYDKKAGYQIRVCQICWDNRRCCQHHIERGASRGNSKVIWVCVFDGKRPGCHEKIHNPTSFGLPATWAYDNGYLKKLNIRYKKIVKNKTCLHKAQIFDIQRGCLVCQFCKKEVKGFSGEKAQPIEKKTKSFKRVVKKTPSVKMGFEKQNPQILEAEKLKRRYTSINLSIKQCSNPEELKLLKEEKQSILSKMKELQNSIEE